MRKGVNGFAEGVLRVSENAEKRSPIKGMSFGDMPRERLARHGVEALKDQELLAILLGTGYRGQNVIELARTMLEAHPKEALMEMEIEELGRLKGVGKAKASLLVAAFELARRALNKGLGARPVISCPIDTVPLLTDIREQRREFFLCLYLNARNQLLHKEVISIGSLSASIVHPREVFQVAVARSAASIILAHNHPSGDSSPSRDDIELTRRLVQAGEIMGIEILDHIIISSIFMGIEILDHIIISSIDFVSLKERGAM